MLPEGPPRPQSSPSQRRSSIKSSARSRLAARGSRSSTRSSISPPAARAESHATSAANTFPRCIRPEGVGANRPRTRAPARRRRRGTRPSRGPTPGQYAARAAPLRLREALVLVETDVAAVVREQVIAAGPCLAQVVERGREEPPAPGPDPWRPGRRSAASPPRRRPRGPPAAYSRSSSASSCTPSISTRTALREPRVLLGRPRQARPRAQSSRRPPGRLDPALGEQHHAQDLALALGEQRPRGLREVVRELDLARRALRRPVEPREPRAPEQLRRALEVLRAKARHVNFSVCVMLSSKLRYRRHDGTSCRLQTQGGAMADTPIKRALVSVTDKTGVVAFVKAARGRVWRRGDLHRRHRARARGGPASTWCPSSSTRASRR